MVDISKYCSITDNEDHATDIHFKDRNTSMLVLLVRIGYHTVGR